MRRDQALFTPAAPLGEATVAPPVAKRSARAATELAPESRAVSGTGTAPAPEQARQLGPATPVVVSEAPVSDGRPQVQHTPGTVLSTTAVADTVTVLRVQKPPGFAFKPGQHIKVGLDGAGQNSYTIASAPHEPHLEFCIERVPGGKLSPKLVRLEPGARVTLGSQPKGGFTFASEKSLHVMIATVTGIAPYRSMLVDAFHAGTPPGKVVVLHGASYADELVYAETFEDLASAHPEQLRYLPTVSRPEAPQNLEFRGGHGRVDVLARELMPEWLDQRDGVQIYACGNPGMIDSVKRHFGAQGFDVASEAYD